MKMMRQKRGGFTLVEIMLAVSVFTLIVGGAFATFLTCNRIWYSTSVDMLATRDANLAMSRILYGLGTNDGLRSASSVDIDTNCAGVYKCYSPFPTNYPPDPGARNHWVATNYTADGSWRMMISNYDGRVTWIDYNINASNLVYWPDITDMTGASRQGMGDYVTSATATPTGAGIEIMLNVIRSRNTFTTTSQVSSFIRLRNQ